MTARFWNWLQQSGGMVGTRRLEAFGLAGLQQAMRRAPVERRSTFVHPQRQHGLQARPPR